MTLILKLQITKASYQNTQKNYNGNQIRTCKLIILDLMIGN